MIGPHQIWYCLLVWRFIGLLKGVYSPWNWISSSFIIYFIDCFEFITLLVRASKGHSGFLLGRSSLWSLHDLDTWQGTVCMPFEWNLGWWIVYADLSVTLNNASNNNTLVMNWLIFWWFSRQTKLAFAVRTHFEYCCWGMILLLNLS